MIIEQEVDLMDIVKPPLAKSQIVTKSINKKVVSSTSHSTAKKKMKSTVMTGSKVSKAQSSTVTKEGSKYQFTFSE